MKRNKEVHEIGRDLLIFLNERDKGESVTALIVALALTLKKRSKGYTAFRTDVLDTIRRLTDLTNIPESEFKATLKLMTEMRDAA